MPIWIGQFPGRPDLPEAVEAARNSDVAIVCVGTAGTEGEGTDRPSMALPGSQDDLIKAVAAANPKTIVVLNNGTPCLLTGWLTQVPGLIEAWFPGQEGGHALAAISSSAMSTRPASCRPRWRLGAKIIPTSAIFPAAKGHVDYAEGIYVGYRHFDKAQIAPLFPFGYGLSYTTFRYGPLTLSKSAIAPTETVTASLSVTNTGHREGAEVVELYVHDPRPKIDKPVRELKGFQKITLMPGETRAVSFAALPSRPGLLRRSRQAVEGRCGDYDLEAGASSRDIRQRARVRLSRDYMEPIPYLGEQKPARNVNDLALNRPVTASSVEGRDDVKPEFTTDGDDSTRWSSQFSDPQWIAVDLGKPVTIDHVRLNWEDAYAAAYAIQVSLDGKTWHDVYTTQDGQGGIETVKFASVLTRWVRMLGTKRATQFGYSLFSFEVYAPER